MERPDNWDKIVNDNVGWKDRESFEAGADAILEALKDKSPYGVRGELVNLEVEAINLTPEPPAYAWKKGWLVFIEDKEVI